MAIDIRQTILSELKRQKKSRYWLAHEAGLSTNGVFIFLRGDGGARMDSIEAMLDALNMRIVPGEGSPAGKTSKKKSTTKSTKKRR